MSNPGQGPPSAAGTPSPASPSPTLPSKRPLSPSSSEATPRAPPVQTPAAGPSTAPTPDIDDAEEQVDDALDASAGAQPIPAAEEWYELQFKWSGKSFDLRVSSSDLVYDLRAQIATLTSVPPDAQKILGLVRGKLGGDVDGTRIGTLGVKPNAKFTLVGTPEHLRFKEREGPPPPDEFDIAYSSARPSGARKLIPPAEDPRNKRQVEKIIIKYPITVMNEPREGKGLLVLDLDYTMVDSRPLLDGALPPLECARPGLHDFLERVYPFYDIVVWSQTSWMWLESKLVELGVLGGEGRYKICFVADRTTMFPIFSERGGKMIKHEVKPLAYFWASFPQWSPKNTIHIDDLARNFALNPGEGLKIRAYKGAGTADGLRDRELDKLGAYLTDIAEHVKDFTTLDHSVSVCCITPADIMQRWKKRQATARPTGAESGAVGDGQQPDGAAGGSSG
ncbi:hypothetical protein VHUM_00373 [Vanrija humicola]|uniref:Nuclear proteasome inhibitor UBLCP1 n=1 Tax=Vanrija humicola TaxID=5417 RepID=A0A7D8V322_VANHU|nr:hypothetical protein VHUM_00373 [Vanrija humicola]